MLVPFVLLIDRNGAITNAKIGNAAITRAKIGDAQVDTLQIAGQAVTIPTGTSRTSDISSNGNWRDLLSVYINAEGGRAFAWFSAVSTGNGNYFRFVLDGAVKHEIGAGDNPGPNGILDCGTQYGVTVKVQGYNAIGNVNINYAGLIIMGTKR